jgi:hypothetical protein
LTRAERIAELDELSLHYDKTLQKEMLMGPRRTMQDFRLTRPSQMKTSVSQNGKVVEESQIDLEKGVV